MSKLHPLHTVEMITTMIRDTGEYFDQNRRTGRSTALALKYIADAISNPYKPIRIVDHAQPNGMPATCEMNRHLARMVFDIVRHLRYEHMLCNCNECTLTFGRPRPRTVTPTPAASVKPQSAPPIPTLREAVNAWERAFM